MNTPDYKSGYLAEFCNDIYNIIYGYIFVCFGCHNSLKKEYYVYFNKCKCPGKYICITCWRKIPRQQCYICYRYIFHEYDIINRYINSALDMSHYEKLCNAYKKCLKSYKTIIVHNNGSFDQEIAYSDDNTADEFMVFVQNKFTWYKLSSVTLDGEQVCGDKLMSEYKINPFTNAVVHYKK